MFILCRIIQIKTVHIIFSDSLHALLEHRVTSGLADDDICPLHHHNTDEEGCVASELHNLTLLVCLHRERERKKQRHNIWLLNSLGGVFSFKEYCY